jgi:hypothetical protein
LRGGNCYSVELLKVPSLKIFEMIYMPEDPPNECEIEIEDASPDDDNNAVWWLSALSIGEINVTSVKDMVDKILDHIEKEKCCIKKLTIMGHGGPGQISVGDGDKSQIPGKMIGVSSVPAKKEDIKHWKPELNRLRGKFCKDAKIILHGCNVGADEEGAELLSLIANNLGVTVRAPTNPPQPFDTNGNWQEAKPGIKPRPKPAIYSKKKKKKKPSERSKECIYIKRPEGPRIIELREISTISILPIKEPKNITSILNHRITSKELTRNILDGIDIFDPFNAGDFPMKVDANLYMWLKGEGDKGIPLIPVSYICGGYRYLIPGGDYGHAYHIIEDTRMMIRKIIKEPQPPSEFRDEQRKKSGC